jgi:ABC-type branched-subunit amino acid transport system ATPase component
MSVAVVTLALAVAVEAFWFDNSAYTGGLNGALVKPPSLIGLDLSVGAGTQRATFGIMCVLVLVTVAVSVAMLRRSRLGGAMLAVRANERSAAAAGINVRVVKLLAFGISAFIAGLGGDLLVYQQTSVSAASFSAIGGIALFATVYLAGVTSVSGGVIGGMLAAGGLFFIVLDKGFNTGSWYDVITGIALILTVIANPEGLARGVHKLGDLWHFRRSGSTGRHGSADSIDMDPGVADRPRVAQSIRSSADRSGPPLLEVSDVSVSYGGVVALNNVSLSVPAGAVVGLIGPNGAGKTTLVDAISGFATMQGDIRFAGQSISGLKPHRRIRRGLARTFQGIELYDDLTVAENVSVGDQSRRLGGEDLPKLLRPLGLEPLLSRPVAELSQGRRQLVSIARSLAGGPSLLLLDEPAAGLDSRESEWLAERLREIRTRGVTLLVIDHDMNLMLNLCDQLYVLDVGSIIASGTPDEVSRNERVRQAYLGAPREAESTPRGDSLPLDVETHLDVR